MRTGSPSPRSAGSCRDGDAMSDDTPQGSPRPEGSSIWREEESAQKVGDLPSAHPEALWRQEEGANASPVVPRGDTSLWNERAATVAPSSAPVTNGKDESRGPKGRKGKDRSVAGRRVRRATWLTVAILLALFVADGVYAVMQLRSSLESSSENLSDGREAIGSGALDRAETSFADAQDEAETATGMLSRPSLKAVSYLPLINRDVDVLNRLTEGAELIAAAGAVGVDVARSLGVSDEGLAASIYSDGVVRLEQLEEVQPQLQRTARMLTRAESLISDAPRPLVAPLRDALVRARRQVTDAGEGARDGAALFAALPELLGGDGERRYLLAFQAIGEARATGGVIGLYGILRTDAGRMELGRIGPYTDVVPGALDEPVDAPTWFEESYGPQFALREWQQANSSPNFPVVSEVLLEMFERGTGEVLDGVIAMDPIALQQMMEGTGPLEVAGSEPISSAEIEEVLLRDSYLRFEDSDQQNLYLAQLVNSFWTKIRDGDFDPDGLAKGLGQAASTRHLSVYSRTSESQRALREIEAAGEYGPKRETNVQLVFHNNYTVSKVGYYLERSISTDIELTERGEALVTTEVTMRNLAPDGPPSLLLGPGVQGDEPGLNRMLFNVLVPRGSTFEEIEVDGAEVPLLEFRDGRFPVSWDVVEIPPGGDARVKVTYRVVNAISTDDGIPTFRFRMVPQALVNPDRFSITIEAPSGLALAEGHPDTPGITRFTKRGVLDTSKLFEFVIVDPSD